MSLTWTTDKPTEPGWYWYKFAEGPPSVVYALHPSGMSIVEVLYDQTGLFCRHPDNDKSLIELDGHWAGPLEPPK